MSAQVYGISVVAGILAAVALAAVAALQVARLEEARRSIALRIAALPEGDLVPEGDGAPMTMEAIKMLPPTDEEVDELLTTLATPMPGAPPGAEIELTGTLVEVSAALTAARTRKAFLRVLLQERIRVETARAGIAPTLAGPIVMCLLVAFGAGAMLPGSDGFAAAHFQLNTGLILFLSYGLAFLGAWIALSIGLLVARGPKAGTGPAF